MKRAFRVFGVSEIGRRLHDWWRNVRAGSGVAEGAVRNWLERDEKKLNIPSGGHLRTLCQAAGYSTDWVLFGDCPERRGTTVSEGSIAEGFREMVLAYIRYV